MTGGAQISIRAVSTIHGDTRFSQADFSADGQTVLTRCATGLERWDAQTGAPLPPPQLGAAVDSPAPARFDSDPLEEAAAEAVRTHFNGWDDLVTISPSGRFIAVGSSSGYLGVVDRERDLPLLLQGHTTSMNNHMYQNSIIAMRFDSRSSCLISVAEEDGDPLLWDLSAAGTERVWNGGPGLLFDQPVHLNDYTPTCLDTVQFSPVGSKFVTTHGSLCRAHVWEIQRPPQG